MATFPRTASKLQLWASALLYAIFSCAASALDVPGNNQLGNKAEEALTPVTISKFAPASGLPGTHVVISGWGFDGNEKFNRVKFGEVPAQIIAAAQFQLTVIVPENAVTAPITVTNIVNWAANKAGETKVRYAVQSDSDFTVPAAKEKSPPAKTPAKTALFSPAKILPPALVIVAAPASSVSALPPVVAAPPPVAPTPPMPPTPTKSARVPATDSSDQVLMTSTLAALSFKPYGIAAVGAYLFVSASEQHQIYKVSLETGESTLFAGTGDEGRADGVASAASFNFPLGLTSDGQYLFVADSGNNLIRKIALASGHVSTLAGSGAFGLADGQAKESMFATPSGIATDGTYLYVTDTASHRIRRTAIRSAETLTLAGSGSPGNADGAGVRASFNLPSGIAVDGNNLYITDSGNHAIRKIALAGGQVETLAGSDAPGVLDGAARSASFNAPSAVTAYGDTLFIIDQMNHAIRKMGGAANAVSIAAGSGMAGSSDGIPASATFNTPFGICAVDNAFYVTDTNNRRIRKLEYFIRVSQNKNR